MVITKEINLQSKGQCDIIDITSQVKQQVTGAGIENGTVTLFVIGSTAGLTTIEYEPGVLSDFSNMWDRLVSQDIGYDHDRTWGDGNGYSHVRASLLGPSLVIPFTSKKLSLGTWQQIVFVDFDNRPRSRQVVAQFMGD